MMRTASGERSTRRRYRSSLWRSDSSLFRRPSPRCSVMADPNRPEPVYTSAHPLQEGLREAPRPRAAADVPGQLVRISAGEDVVVRRLDPVGGGALPHM